MGINIFPPILDKYQPAFINNVASYAIYFDFSDLTNISNINNIQIRLYYQDSNENALDINTFPDGIIVLPKENNLKYDEERKKYYIEILKSSLEQGKGWIAGQFYKVQIRVGTGSFKGISQSQDNYFTWKKEQIKNGQFSEWSEIMIIYPIAPINLELLNNSAGNLIPVISSNKVVEFTMTPTFVGKYSTKIYEPIDKYRFLIYKKGEQDEEEKLLEDSDWIQYKNQNKEELSEENGYSTIIRHRFNQLLNKGIRYRVIFQVLTRNMYLANSNSYSFNVEYSPLIDNEKGILKLESYNNNSNYCEKMDEEGMIRLHLYAIPNPLNPSKEKENLSIIGNYVLMRQSEKDNFTSSEEITYFTFNNDNVDKYYEDYTVESGVRYKYYLQKENSAQLRFNPSFDEQANTELPVSNFNCSYLGNKERQFKLLYNNSVNNYKQIVLDSKQETLNSKYPIIFKNGVTNYSEFNISGLITFNLVNNQNYKFMHRTGRYLEYIDGNGKKIEKEIKELTSDSILKFEDFQFLNSKFRKNYSMFLENENQKKGQRGYYYKDKLIIPQDKIIKQTTNYNEWKNNINSISSEKLEYNSFNQDLTKDNIFIERKFREAVLDFLYDGKPKIFKSPTEGNKIVYLTNISLTPEQGINRLIYNFSATAQEICEYNYSNLKKYDLVNYNKFQENLSEEDETQFGQISGFYEGLYTRDLENNQKQLYPIKNDKPVDLIKIIQDQIKERMKSNKYQYKVKSVNKIKIEPYPKVSLNYKLLEINKKIADIKIQEPQNKENILKQLYKEKDYVQNLQKEIDFSGKQPFYNLIVNGKEIVLNLNTPFILEDVEINSLLLKYSGAVVLNYICKTIQVEREEEVTRVNRTYMPWGQIQGIFTDNKKNLLNYSQDLKQINDKDNLQIKNIVPDSKNPEKKTVVKTTMDLYKTLNIMDVIKQKSREEVKKLYNETLDSMKYNKETKIYYSNNHYYQFNNLESIDIEGDPGTELLITGRENKTSAPLTTNLVKIGPTGKLKYYNSNERMIEDIRLKKPSYLIINYSCNINYEIKGKRLVSEIKEEIKE